MQVEPKGEVFNLIVKFPSVEYTYFSSRDRDKVELLREVYKEITENPINVSKAREIVKEADLLYDEKARIKAELEKILALNKLPGKCGFKGP